MALATVGPRGRSRAGPRAGRALAAGLAGAATAALLEALGRRVLAPAPRAEVPGEHAVAELLRRLGRRPRGRDALLLAVERVSSGVWFAVAGIARRHAVVTGAALGALAGAGALVLPPALGPGPSRRSARSGPLAFGAYLAGGVVAGLVGRALAPPQRPDLPWRIGPPPTGLQYERV